MKVFGLIGEKLGHSLSPIIHQKIYELIDIDATYSLYQVQPNMLKAAVDGIRALDIQGVNVTIPYKVSIMEYLDEISTEARKIGAVNTILNKDSYLTGYNTDYIGFGRMLEKYNINVANTKAAILGNGGAARSVATFLEDNGIEELYIVARNPEKVTGFNRFCKIISHEDLNNISNGYLLVNCTPVGMHPKVDAAPISKEQISKFDYVVDLIYNPSCTLLMQQAKDLGIPAYNGLYMLVSQAVAAVEIWNNIEIPHNIVDVVYKELENYLNK